MTPTVDRYLPSGELARNWWPWRPELAARRVALAGFRRGFAVLFGEPDDGPRWRFRVRYAASFCIEARRRLPGLNVLVTMDRLGWKTEVGGAGGTTTARPDKEGRLDGPLATAVAWQRAADVALDRHWAEGDKPRPGWTREPLELW